MNETDWKRVEGMITNAVNTAVSKTVNGRFDPKSPTFALKEINEHMEEAKPYLQGLAGARLIGHSIKWLGGVAIAWLVLKDFLR